MTLATHATPDEILTTAALVAPLDRARPPVVPGTLRRAARAAGNLLGAVGIVLCVPVAILAVGAPIALGVRFLLWTVGML